MKKILILVLCVSGVAAGQASKTSPGFSLSKLDNVQCTYAVSALNHLTRIVTLAERNELTEANGAWPKPPNEKLDTFVSSKVEQFIHTSVDIGGAMMLDYKNHSGTKELDHLKLRIGLEQREFAYVLELRGCLIERSQVNFAK
jgi:hypothetical protein